MKSHLGALLLCLATILASPAWAEGNAADVTDMQALRTAVRADKKAYVASVMKLTDAEAKKFWPAYDAYQRDLDMTNREKNVTLEGVIAQDKPMSDPYAKQIAKDLIAADEAEVKARRTLYNRLMKAVPPKKALRYLQLEAKIRAVQAYDIAQAIAARQIGAGPGIPGIFCFFRQTALTSAPFPGEPGPPMGGLSGCCSEARSRRLRRTGLPDPAPLSHRTILCLETTC